ncbi:hypothetical protein ACQY0O_003511 [Thecaphora frezii]
MTAQTKYDDADFSTQHAGSDPSYTLNDDLVKPAPPTASSATGSAARRAAPSSGTGAGAPGGIITVQPFSQADMQPSYRQEFGGGEVDHGFYGTMMNGLGAFTGFLGQLPCCFCCPNPYKEIKQGSVGLVSRFGRAIRAEDPGLVKINPCSESLRIVDVKIMHAVIPRISVTTVDNVSVDLDSVIFWHVFNPYRAAYGISDVRDALIERAQTTLRHVVGSRTLQSIISDREQVAAEIEEIVENVADKWGVKVESILIKDIIFSKELQESLSSAATQRRIGESKVVGARAEVAAARLMRQAADILASPAAMQIRQLEALQSMAKQANSKVIFVPMNLDGPGAQALMGAGGSAQGSGTIVTADAADDAAADAQRIGGTSATAGSGGLSVQSAAGLGQLSQM